MNRNDMSAALEDGISIARDRAAPLLDKAERLKAALSDTVDEQLRVARRAARDTKVAAEDLADDLRTRTRKEPLKHLGIALGIGAAIGLLMGWKARK